MNKRRTIKKGLAILLVVAMLFSIMPVSAFAENTDSTEPGGQTLMNMQSETTTPAAYVTIGDGEPEEFETLAAAIEEVKNCTAGDNAVVTLAKDITLDARQEIASGDFIIDLNENNLSSMSAHDAVLYITGGTVKIQNGSISITNGSAAVWLRDGSPTVKIIDCVINSNYYGVAVSSGNVTITGGSITGDIADLWKQSQGLKITLEEEVKFPEGIKVLGNSE